MIGNRIKEIRQDNKFNQKDFAKILGVKPSYISMLENHKKTPSPMLVKSICTNFMVKEEWLTTGKGDKHIKLSDIRANSAEWLNKLAAWADKNKDDSVSNIIHEMTSSAPESTIVREPIKRLILDLLEDEDIKKGLTGLLADVFQNIAAKSDDNETKLKKIEKIISNACQPPEGIKERRRCKESIDKILYNINQS